ncbi:type VII secretion system-associated protein [Lentzea sp. NPDC004782]|uniref:type VII secretion system-associated protein n=1 Tax=Lentzea sp. NPDC004782 TaxID=3154458 RepID=UPI0033A5E275
MTDPIDGAEIADRQENWFLLMDPAWQPEAADAEPPLEAIVGVWPLDDGGHVGKFRANPGYRPTDERSPSDPLDAVLRLVMQGRAEAEQIQLMLRDSMFDVAMNDDTSPLIALSPDNVKCVVVATGEPHRRRIRSPQWLRTDLEDLVVLLADGVDVLFNPGGPASVRLYGDFVRNSLLLDDKEVAELYERYREAQELRIKLWERAEDTAPQTDQT